MSKRPLRTKLSPVVMTMIGISKQFHNISLDDFNTFEEEDLQSVKDFIKDYIDKIDDSFDNNVGLFMRGANGVGKSMLASIIVKEAYRHRYTAKRLTFMEYLTAYSNSKFAKGEDKEELEEQFYNDIKAVEFLVLEEVGKETDVKSTFNITVLEDCLRYREEKGLVTIICTNMDSRDFSDKYGKSIASLVKGNCIPIEIVGEDRRVEEFHKRAGI